jgi:hypothetical protein
MAFENDNAPYTLPTPTLLALAGEGDSSAAPAGGFAPGFALPKNIAQWNAPRNVHKSPANSNRDDSEALAKKMIDTSLNQIVQALANPSLTEEQRASLMAQQSQLEGLRAQMSLGASGVNVQQILSTALAASATVASTVASVGSGAGVMGAAGLSANMQVLTAMHRELYNSDPIYREQADRIVGGILEDRGKKDARDKSVSQQFADAGIHTSVDDKLNELHKKMKGLKQPQDNQEIARLNAEIDAARIQQTEEWKQIAHDMGRPDLEALADKEITARNKEFEDSMKLRKELFDEMVKAMRRKGVTQESIEKQIKAFDAETVTLTKTQDVKEVKKDILEYKKEISTNDKTVKSEESKIKIQSAENTIASQAHDATESPAQPDTKILTLGKKLASLSPSDETKEIAALNTEISTLRLAQAEEWNKAAQDKGDLVLSDTAQKEVNKIKSDLEKTQAPKVAEAKAETTLKTKLTLAHQDASNGEHILPTRLALNTPEGAKKDSASLSKA